MGLKRKHLLGRCFRFGAGDGARTRYLHLGKVALYQMSYARTTVWIIADAGPLVNTVRLLRWARYLSVVSPVKTLICRRREPSSSGVTRQIALAQKKRSKLLGYNAAGQLSDRDFLSMNKDCEREISEAERQIYDLEQQPQWVQ